MNPLTNDPSSRPPADALRAWMQRERPQFDQLEPRADLWGAIEAQLPAAEATLTAAAAPDALRTWMQHQRPAFDVLTPRADAWDAIARQLDADAPVGRPVMTAQRGGAHPAARPAWWQLAAAAAVVFGLGYGLRVGTEPTAAPIVAQATEQPDVLPAADGGLHVAAPRHSFHSQEPDPAMQAAILASNVDDTEEVPAVAAELTTPAEPRRAAAPALAPEITRLEARYAALVARHRASAKHRFVATHSLADEWDREMAVLDSSYAALRQELPRNRHTDEVVAAMNRNLHLRLKLLQQQMMALDAVQEVRQRAGRVVPRRPPTVNPEDNGVNLEDIVPGGGTLVPPAPPAPEPLPGLGAQITRRPKLAV